MAKKYSSSLTSAALILTLLNALTPSVHGQVAALPQSAIDFNHHWKAINSQEQLLKKNLMLEKEPLFSIVESAGEQKGARIGLPISRDLILRKNQLGQPYLLAATLEKGTGENGILSSGSFWLGKDIAFLILFKQISADKIQVLRLNLDWRAKAGTSETEFLNRSIPAQPIVTLPILKEDQTRETLTVSADKLLMTDFAQIESQMRQGYASEGYEISFSAADSAVEKIRALPQQLEAAVNLGFVASSQDGGKEILSIGMRYVLTELPQSPSFQPRKANPRVGYFTTDYDLIRHPTLGFEPTTTVRLIHRWNLEPIQPIAKSGKVDGPLIPSPVKNPIVYWIDPSVPKVYRPAVKAGILAWNAAFAAIGFKDPIVVKEVDSDMPADDRSHYNPDNLAYNVIRWYTSNDGTDTSAIGPSRANPFTGEIFNASVSISDTFVRKDAINAILSSKKSKKLAQHSGEDSFLEKARLAAVAGLAELRARGVSPSEEAKYLSQYITEITMHEIGHTLGLRHNFKGSHAYQLEEMGKNGLISSSVMDYLPPHIAPPGKKQEGPYFMTKPGAYDFWAIRYGYAPVANKKELAEIADLAEKDPRLAYATDKDAQSNSDPDTQKFDLGSDPIAFANSEIKLADYLWKNIESRPNQKNAARLSQDFSAGFRFYFMAEDAAIPLIGGVRTTRSPMGRQFDPVQPAEQRQALDFLARHVFSDRDFKVSPRFLSRLGNDRLLENSINRPFPLLGEVESIQDNALKKIYDPARLSRLAQAPLYARPTGALSTSELFFRVRRSIWGEIMGQKPRPISIYRRRLQTSHVNILIKTLRGDAPEESRAAAARDLRLIASDCRKALAKPLDNTTRLHLEAIVSLIAQAIMK